MVEFKRQWIEFIEYINNPDIEQEYVFKSSLNRLIGVPFAVLWWTIQTFIWWIVGAFIILPLSLTALSGADNPHDRAIGGLFTIIYFILPFVWWYRYIKFGDFGYFIKEWVK